MFTYFNDVFVKSGASGWKLDLLVAITVATIVTLAVVVFGQLVDHFETFCLRLITKVFNANVALFVCNKLTFPGVILHELAHAFMIFITGGKILKLRLLEFNRNGRLGHVEFQVQGPKKKQMIQLACGSSAPVLMGLVEVILLYRVVTLHDLGILGSILIWYLIVSIVCHMSMSKEDLKSYFHGMLFIYPCLVAIFLVIQYFFVRVQ